MIAMSFPAGRNASLRRCGGVVLAVALLLAGCETTRTEGPGSKPYEPGKPPEIDPPKVKSRDDVFQIVQFWPQTPWLQKSDRIVGFKVTVYFRSSETGLGAFVSGDIFAWVYELVLTEDGHREPKLVHMWQLKEAEAMGYRVRKRSIQGYYYGFPLAWPQELTLEGKQVEIQFGYERADKRVILSEPRQFRVPMPIGYRPPTKETER